jgi:acyl CoA:acetate/3-ketoacid CoA transferase alpha subunit/acyl CoA:acetate/3-ketoacid CoA transferase beta subunit
LIGGSVAAAFPLSAGGPIDRMALVDHWHNRLTATAGTSKVICLPDAIRDAVRPHDAVYLGGSLARPNAAAFELTRQFYGTDPQLTLIAPAFANQHAVLVHAGLVAKVITSLHGNTYPGPGPNPIFTEADRAGTVTFEDWSMLTLVLRLYAAATNVPFLPTRSLIGTDLGQDLINAGLLKLIDDPFGDGDQTALVPPLHPDVVIMHALMADESGNAVMPPPHYEDAWAAFAARRTVILTTEKVVSTATIRRHAQFVRVPAAAVSAVCEVPFGSHPNQVPGDLVPEVGGYYDDYAFLAELRKVCRDPQELSAWTKRWILDAGSHRGYLDLLGETRLADLQAKVAPAGWQDELAVLDERWSDPASPGELNAVLGARYLHSLVIEDGLRTGLAGVGVSTLAAWLATASLHEAGVAFDLLAEGGMYGYTPLPLDPYLFNYRNLFTSTSLSNAQTILNVVGGGFANRTVGVLGAAQVDSRGSINTSRINGRMLTGAGGGNDIASTAAAVVVTTAHDRARLPETVDFVTSPGHRVRAIVTDRAVIERQGTQTDFRLTAVLEQADYSKDKLIREAVERCGWNLAVADVVDLLPPVDDKELAAVRTFDPAGNFVL